MSWLHPRASAQQQKQQQQHRKNHRKSEAVKAAKREQWAQEQQQQKQQREQQRATAGAIPLARARALALDQSRWLWYTTRIPKSVRWADALGY